MNNSIKDIQTIILDIYKSVKEICDKNNIRYFAIGGTCIGAVRHNGFIPWDDDLDIAMPDIDYNRFIELAKKELPDYLEIRYPRDISTSHRLEIKVCNRNTTLIEKLELNCYDAYKGIYIDVMPLCGLPNDNKLRNRFCFKLKLLFRLNYCRRTPFAHLIGIRSKMVWILCYPFHVFKNDFWYKKWESLAFRYKFDESNLTGYIWSKKIGDKLIFKKSLFDDVNILQFEDTMIPCPIGYDEMLKQQFGDYMILPPEKERKVHSFNGILDVNKSYLEYQKEIKQ